MSKRARLIKDFKEWSGGFEPHETDNEQNKSYVANARPSYASSHEANKIIAKHIAKRHGTGHDMSIHGEGKKHGDK